MGIPNIQVMQSTHVFLFFEYFTVAVIVLLFINS